MRAQIAGIRFLKPAPAVAQADEKKVKPEPGLPESEALQTWLYGQWQTVEWHPPVAVDGIVPKNQRGTVHCPPLAAALPVVSLQVARLIFRGRFRSKRCISGFRFLKAPLIAWERVKA